MFDLEEAKKQKMIDLNIYIYNKITAGFKSSAKGSEYMYDCTQADQMSLDAMYNASRSPSFETSEYNGEIQLRAVRIGSTDKVILEHNAAEMQQLIYDKALHIIKCKKMLWDLQTQIDACTSEEDLKKIKFG